MRLAEVWRYPVKSMAGERLEAAEVQSDGVGGDRRFGVAGLDGGHILSAKREGRLLLAAARLEGGAPVITLPDGTRLDGPGSATDRALSAWLARPVALVEASGDVPTFVAQEDEDDDDSGSVTWDGQPGRLVDSSPLHLLTTASLRAMGAQRADLAWRVPRFRPNLVVEADGDERVEDAWPGATCTVGAVRLSVTKPCTRCVMVNRAQPAAGLDRQPQVLKHLVATSDANLGVLARVAAPGRLAVGDEVRVDAVAGG